MINNIIEIWYWTVMLAILVGAALYYAVYLVKQVWKAIKKHLSDAP